MTIEDTQITNNKEIITAREYFERLKNSKQEMTDIGLSQFYQNCLVMKDKFVKLDQVDALKKLIFLIETVRKEKQCLEIGINQYVNREDIDNFIDNVKSDDIAFIELTRYERVVPDDIQAKAELSKCIFDNMYVLFTDYSKVHHKKQEKYVKETDPILFGTFEQDQYIHDRFYYIGDWVDEYCDLTLEKFIAEYRKINPDIEVVKPITDFSHIDDISSLKTTINSLQFDSRLGKYVTAPKKSIIESMKDKVKGFFK